MGQRLIAWAADGRCGGLAVRGAAGPGEGRRGAAGGGGGGGGGWGGGGGRGGGGGGGGGGGAAPAHIGLTQKLPWPGFG